MYIYRVCVLSVVSLLSQNCSILFLLCCVVAFLSFLFPVSWVVATSEDMSLTWEDFRGRHYQIVTCISIEEADTQMMSLCHESILSLSYLLWQSSCLMRTRERTDTWSLRLSHDLRQLQLNRHGRHVLSMFSHNLTFPTTHVLNQLPLDSIRLQDLLTGDKTHTLRYYSATWTSWKSAMVMMPDSSVLSVSVGLFECNSTDRTDVSNILREKIYTVGSGDSLKFLAIK